MQLGELVVSIAGRDKGRYFIVVNIINEDYVKVADGDLRRIENPKKKNIKHLKSEKNIFDELSIWLARGKRIRNEDLKNIIQNYYPDFKEGTL